jgi:lysyl-tRNA synthetase, class II
MLGSAWRTVRTPLWLARVVFLVGAVTALSALLPALRDRTAIVDQLVPAVFPAAAATGAAGVGAILIALSRALRRGKRRAWLLATVLAAVTVVLHLVKGLDVEEASLSVVLLVLLATSGAQFRARPDPRSLGRSVGVLVGGTSVAWLLGWCWLSMDADGQAPGTSVTGRLTQALLGLVGVPGPVRFLDPSDSSRASVALAVLGATLLLVAVLVALQPADGPHPLTEREAVALRGLLSRWGAVDSLSYFCLRDDRSAIFSPSGKSAITYRVVGTVSLAAGDPVGDPEAWPGAVAAWLEEARSFGWVPAVVGASERGAAAFHRAGLDALELGDEAVVEVAGFSLSGRRMRTVRQAVSRVERAGLQVTCHRVGDLSEERLRQLVANAEEWRDGAVERGFSMALGRFGSRCDPGAVVAVSTDLHGDVRGLLHFVPWGQDGLSLDVMRRDRGAENGIVEQLVAGVLAAAPCLGVTRISLNFAVFRSVFARGERLGAGPVLRLWRSVLLSLSRFWQIESLYRANAKYQPEWVPRFVCFRSPSDLPRVSVAALRAEALFAVPAPWRSRSRDGEDRGVGAPARSPRSAPGRGERVATVQAADAGGRAADRSRPPVHR